MPAILTADGGPREFVAGRSLDCARRIALRARQTDDMRVFDGHDNDFPKMAMHHPNVPRRRALLNREQTVSDTRLI
jgi:hypothetical protein